MDWKDGLR